MASRLFSRFANLQRRCFSSASGAGQELRDAIRKEEAAAAETMKLWKKLSIFVVIPAVLLTAYNAYIKEKEHMSHERPPFIAYQHLRIRNKAFPWGDGNHTIFHNPHTNALPDGYEDEHDH